jgi:hypothetical protein
MGHGQPDPPLLSMTTGNKTLVERGASDLDNHTVDVIQISVLIFSY